MASKHTEQTSHCPVCKTSIPFEPRYPSRPCWPCAGHARDVHGRLLTFHTSSEGSFEARFATSKDISEVTSTHIVYIGAYKFWADEAHMGGNVLIPFPEPHQLSPPLETCPVCHKIQSVNARYPRMVCGECVGNATDAKGRELSFGNTAKGLEVRFRRDGKVAREVEESHTVWVGALKCWAAEAHMGGYVLTPYRGK